MHSNTRTPGGSSHGCSVHCRYSEYMTVMKSDYQPVSAPDGSAALPATSGIQSVSSTSGLVTGQGGLWPPVDDGSWVAGIRHVVAEAGQDLAEPEHVSIDLYADLCRPQAHTAARCDSS